MGINDVVGLKIKGANFENETPLELFSTNADQGCTLVYGKNGAGKSTISRGFLKISGKDEETIDIAALFDSNHNQIDLSDEEKGAIYVFNENYVDENVKLNKDATGLETIVVLGQKVDVQKKLEAAEKNYSDAKKEYEKQENLMLKYSNVKSKESPLYWSKAIKEKLKEKDGWAQRDQKIKNNARATNVTDTTHNSFITLKPSKTELALRTEYAEKLTELNDARTGKKKIEKVVDINRGISLDKQQYVELLALKIEKPELTEREKYLLSLQKEYGSSHTDDIKKVLGSSDVNRCPYCLQEITQSYKEELFKSIQNILSKEADEHQIKLRRMLINSIAFDATFYDEIDTYVKPVQDALEVLNKSIAEWNELVEQKINDIYTPIEGVIFDIDVLYEKYIDTLQELENARQEYNKGVADTKPIETELTAINADIAYFEIKDAYNELCNAQTSEKNDKAKLVSLENIKNTAYNEVQKILQEKRDIKIALKEINEGLKYIFFDNTRLTIELSGDEYILKSRGKTVTPSRVSVGERNAIALCYFFTNILREQKQEEFYKKQYLLVIDDPVSSFDKDNRIGIISYLRKEINKFKHGNSKTKVLVLSHDLQTSYDIYRLFNDIGAKGLTCELKNNSIENINLAKRNEYSKLLQQIYLYARGENSGFEMSVGNAIRRVLEAYSTFNYRKGMSDLSCTPEVIKELGLFSGHFENLMYRLMLDGESHSKERVTTLDSTGFFANLSTEERIRTSKEVICFLYMLDSYHVLQHLKDLQGNTAETDINGWIEDIAKANGIDVNNDIPTIVTTMNFTPVLSK